MSKNNRIHAINSIAERVPDAPSASLPADTSMATYGEDVFGEKEIRAFLPKATAAKLLATVNEGKPLDPSIADDVAHAMKDWAPRTSPTGSSPSRAAPPRSTTASWSRAAPRRPCRHLAART